VKSSHTKHLTYFALMDALEGEGCPLCALVLGTLRRYFDSLVYTQVNDPLIRTDLRSSLGYCAAHGELLRQARSGLGSAIMHRDLLNTAVRRLEQESHTQQSPADWLQGLLQAGRARHELPLAAAQPCPACVYACESEQKYVDTLLAHWVDEEVQSAFRSSAGLCLPHLRMTLGRASDPERFEAIKTAQLQVWGELIGELDEFIRKHDYRFSGEPMGAEGNSWSRAIDLVSGRWQVAGSRCR
jgi:hypothetical protein